VVSTGSLTLDYALRSGGWVQGRIHEIVGPPDVGKSTITITSMREQQLADPERGVAYIDVEGTFDYDWAAGLGLDCSDEAHDAGRWAHLYAGTSEEASDMARECTRSGLYSMVAVDSIGGMESMKALARDAEDDLVGKNAQVITRMVKHLASLARTGRTTVLLVNQHRAVVGRFGGSASAGPKAMQHATSTKITMSRTNEEQRKLRFETGGPLEPVATQMRARVDRSKIVPPGRVAEYWICNRHTEQMGPPGIYAIDEYVELGVRVGAIEQGGGGMYTFPGGMKVKGREKVIEAMQEDKMLMAAVRDAILKGEVPHGD
jgi:RecA/RadA recombinase